MMNSIVIQPIAPAKKTDSVPMYRIAKPPMDGEMIRLMCHETELNATALIMFFLLTRSGKNDAFTGPSSPEKNP